MPDALAHVFGLRRPLAVLTVMCRVRVSVDVESDSLRFLVSKGLGGRFARLKSERLVSCSCPLGRRVDDGQLVMIWVVPVSSFGLSGLMRISEEKKNSVSFRSVSFIYVNTYSELASFNYYSQF